MLSFDVKTKFRVVQFQNAFKVNCGKENEQL